MGIVVSMAHKKPSPTGVCPTAGRTRCVESPIFVIFVAEWMFCFATTFRMGPSDVCWFINPSKYR